jgi:hypothetical protein
MSAASLAWAVGVDVDGAAGCACASTGISSSDSEASVSGARVRGNFRVGTRARVTSTIRWLWQGADSLLRRSALWHGADHFNVEVR